MLIVGTQMAIIVIDALVISALAAHGSEMRQV